MDVFQEFKIEICVIVFCHTNGIDELIDPL